MSQAVPQQPRYLAEIELHTEAELLQLLERAQQLSDEGVIQADSAYRELSRRGLVDVRVCETWMGSQRITGDQLPPFIGTVPYGPGEERRLLREEEYVYF
jgi:intracellular sulfur oxidation DsrE/DsrF family protein